jgi:hypothetical protein
MTYILQMPSNYPEVLIGEYLRDQSPDRFIFQQGKLIESIATPKFRFRVTSKELDMFEALQTNAGVLLLSQRTSAVLLGLCPEDVQLIAANVETSDKTTIDYKLLNVTHLVRGLNHKECSVLHIPGTKAIMKFNKISLVPDALKNHHIARESEYLPYVLVSEAIKSAFENRGFKGAAFVRPEDIKP